MASDSRRDRGEVVEWSDEKRCGFVRPRGSRPNDPLVFLSMGAMTTQKRTPKVGDEVLYEKAEVPLGPKTRHLRTRLRAQRVVFVGDDLPLSVSEQRTGGFVAVGAVYLGTLAVLGFSLRPLWLLALANAVFSLIELALYGLDKHRARGDGRRIPESTLQTLALLGGWPGAALAQSIFHHKTQKRSFQTAFRWTVALNLALTAILTIFLLYSP